MYLQEVIAKAKELRPNEADPLKDTIDIMAASGTCDFSGAFLLFKILENPDLIDSLSSSYVLIGQETGIVSSFGGLSIGINLMKEKGWNCIGITQSGMSMYALMEKK
jgi:hypothetical protein